MCFPCANHVLPMSTTKAFIICPHADNCSTPFSHEWKLVSERPPITQIDSGSLGTWAIGPTDTGRAVYALQNDNWTYISNSFVVTVGKSGIWHIGSRKTVSFRMRVKSTQPLGSNWRPTTRGYEQVIQIDSGSSGVIYAVNRCDFVLSILSFLSRSMLWIIL